MNEDDVARCLKVPVTPTIWRALPTSRAVASPGNLEKNIIGSAIVFDASREGRIERICLPPRYTFTADGSFYRVSKQAVEHMLEA